MTNVSSAAYARLSIMMFIQFAVWGSGVVLIAGYLADLGFLGKEISYVVGTTAFGSLILLVIAGWVADRVLPSQVFRALSHFTCGSISYVA